MSSSAAGSPVVLDVSAVLALLFEEPGAPALTADRGWAGVAGVKVQVIR